MVLMGLVFTLYRPAAAEVVNQTITSTASATTIACALAAVGPFDVIIVAISATKAFSSITDNLGAHLTYTQQVASTLATGTVAAQTYLYTAPNTATRQAITVTVTWATSAQAIVVCYDTAGWGGTKAHSSTGSGALTNTNSGYTAAVGSYTPTATNFEVSVFGGSVCGTPATITPPGSSTGSTLFTTPINTATTCKTTAPTATFEYTGGAAYFQSASGGAQTDNYVVSGPNAVNSTNSADWAEAAMDLPANTIVTQSVAETNTLAVHNALASPSLTETNALAAARHLAQAFLTEPDALFTQFALAQAVNIETDCLGVAITVNSVPTLNTGPICGALVVQGQTLIMPCNFFQLQCWEYPLLFLGMYEAFFLGTALAFRFSEKGFIYFVLAGATFGSLTEISLGIMTPMVPIMLIVVNIAYSMRLDRFVTGSREQA